MPKLEPWRMFLKKTRDMGGTKEDAQSAYDYLRRCEHYVSDDYHVAIDKTPEHNLEDIEMWHLSIKRHDREPFHDWRVMQRIKNAICGPEAEGVELYPAESRLVDTSNQYHLWVVVGGVRFPFGWTERAVIDADVELPIAPDAKQRPLSDL